jgi:hypothetical protein
MQNFFRPCICTWLKLILSQFVKAVPASDLNSGERVFKTRRERFIFR